MFQEEEYLLNSRHLTLVSPPSGKFTLEITTEIYPQKNTSLEVNIFFSLRILLFTLKHAECLCYLNAQSVNTLNRDTGTLQVISEFLYTM